MTQPIRYDAVRIASPCAESWADMPGDDARRHCARCAHEVIDLSALTTSQAHALLDRPGPRPCLRITVRVADDTVVTREDVAVSRPRRLPRVAASVGVGLAALGAGSPALASDAPAGDATSSPAQDQRPPRETPPFPPCDEEPPPFPPVLDDDEGGDRDARERDDRDVARDASAPSPSLAYGPEPPPRDDATTTTPPPPPETYQVLGGVQPPSRLDAQETPRPVSPAPEQRRFMGKPPRTP